MTPRLLRSQTLMPTIRTIIWLASVNCIIGDPEAQEARSNSPKVVSSNQVPNTKTNSAATSLENDAMLLCSLIEGWSETTSAETEERLSRMYISYLLTYINVSQSELDALVREFKPRIIDSFRSHAAAVFGDIFSHEEILKLIEFYKGPLGRKYAAAYPGLMEKMLQGDLKRLLLRDDVVRRIREKYPDAK